MVTFMAGPLTAPIASDVVRPADPYISHEYLQYVEQPRRETGGKTGGALTHPAENGGELVRTTIILLRVHQAV